MKKFFKTKWFTFSTYILLVSAILLIGSIILQNNSAFKKVIFSFFEVAENRAFDYRQALRIIHKQPTPNKDIVVLAIDDASFEMLWDKYGKWPIPREVYGNIIDHLEKSNPQALIFDLMFIKSMKGEDESDKTLVNAMNKYKNVYTAMNFDNQTSDVRIPASLPDRLALKIENSEHFKLNKKYNYSNCRPILNSLVNGKVNIGMTNVFRSNDGIIRKIAPILKYKDGYYPYLSFGAGCDYLSGEKVTEIKIDNKSNILIHDTKIPLTKDGDTILNWYGISGTHTIYPLYKVVHEMEGKAVENPLDFKDKIIIIGTTAMSLHDTKSVPIQEGVYPGVEVHATFFNNMLDGNFIKQSSVTTNIIIIFSVIAIIGTIVMLTSSTFIALLSTILFTIAYLFTSYYVMEIFNLWIPVVLPSISIILAFALSYLTKYLIKSRDFEYQYKLATIDGLTELYNHRYFQESLKKQIEIARRYEQQFSLIITDIDFFKKFNDTYGHQSGDAVLKQVAQILKKNSRNTDFVCRYGGEEMSIILPNTNANEVSLHANRLLKAIEENEFILNNNVKTNVTISVGIATFPEDADNAQDLIEYADKGLYYAKENGRNQVGKLEKNI